MACPTQIPAVAAAAVAAEAAVVAAAAQAVPQPKMDGPVQALPMLEQMQEQGLLQAGVKGGQKLLSLGVQACAWEQSLALPHTAELAWMQQVPDCEHQGLLQQSL